MSFYTPADAMAYAARQLGYRAEDLKQDPYTDAECRAWRRVAEYAAVNYPSYAGRMNVLILLKMETVA